MLNRARLRIIVALMVVACIAISGCTPAEKFASGIVGVTAYQAGSPSNELEQTYYLGVFDPSDQVPPTLYRVRLHGQSGAFSNVKFASGWVKADLIDSLGSSMSFNRSGSFGTDKLDSPFEMQSQLYLFGPEGYMEAPRDHRLVIVMGSSPEEYFQGIDRALGEVSLATQNDRTLEANSKFFKTLLELSAEKERLATLQTTINHDLK